MIECCRLCGHEELEAILDLGEQVACCYYPLPDEPDADKVPLVLLRCNRCGLPQLSETVPAHTMYREGYGYRSGLTGTMRQHLHDIVAEIDEGVVGQGAWVDIGCNDGTLLSYVPERFRRVGFDPNPAWNTDDPRLEGALYMEAPFSYKLYSQEATALSFPAKVITSIAMIYDLDDPVRFVGEIRQSLSERGTWCAEFMDVRSMIGGAWDQINHEHLTYLGIEHFSRMAERAGLQVREARKVRSNGGSLRVYTTHGGWAPNPVVAEMRRQEQLILGSPEYLRMFAHRTREQIEMIKSVVRTFRRVAVLGASQKGNTVLQACGLTRDDICYASERDPAKVGRETPGTRIPIIHEDEARRDPPDAYLVLAWQFEDEIRQRESKFLEGGGKLILPLPRVRIV